MWIRSALPAAIILVAVSACTGQEARLGDGTPSLKTAETALKSGAPDLAYRICAALVDGGDRSTKTMVCKGNALTGLGRSAEAASVFAVALQGAPNNTDALIGTGRLRLATDPAGAEQLFMKALGVNPRDAVALNNLGIARDLQGRHHDAQAAYSEAIGANPDARAPQINLALSMAMSGRAREATRIIRPLAENDAATARERHDYAAVLTMAGRPEEATQFLMPELSAPQAAEAVSAFRGMPSQGVPLAATPTFSPTADAPLSIASASPLPTAVDVPAVVAATPIILNAPARVEASAVAVAPEREAPVATPIVLAQPTAEPGPAATPAVAERAVIKLNPAPDAPPPPRAVNP